MKLQEILEAKGTYDKVLAGIRKKEKEGKISKEEADKIIKNMTKGVDKVKRL